MNRIDWLKGNKPPHFSVLGKEGTCCECSSPIRFVEDAQYAHRSTVPVFGADGRVIGRVWDEETLYTCKKCEPSNE